MIMEQLQSIKQISVAGGRTGKSIGETRAVIDTYLARCIEQ
jgi:hypothetical protein